MKQGLFTNPRARLRFHEEITLAASLEHANIARVYAGTVDGDVSYYAMQLIEGGMPLDRYVKTMALDRGRVLQLMLKVCDAVRDAHDHRIWHRDLKPANILVTEGDMPHILDFGLAMSSVEDDLRAGMRREVAGTLIYLARKRLQKYRLRVAFVVAVQMILAARIKESASDRRKPN